jgi:hypothetical protein
VPNLPGFGTQQESNCFLSWVPRIQTSRLYCEVPQSPMCSGVSTRTVPVGIPQGRLDATRRAEDYPPASGCGIGWGPAPTSLPPPPTCLASQILPLWTQGALVHPPLPHPSTCREYGKGEAGCGLIVPGRCPDLPRKASLFAC